MDWGIQQGMAEMERRRAARGLQGFGQTQDDTSAVSSSVASALMPILGGTTQQLSQKAADVIGPVIEDKLKQYGPMLAAITGLFAAAFTIIGMAVIGKYILAKVGR